MKEIDLWKNVKVEYLKDTYPHFTESFQADPVGKIVGTVVAPFLGVASSVVKGVIGGTAAVLGIDPKHVKWIIIGVVSLVIIGFLSYGGIKLNSAIQRKKLLKRMKESGEA